MKKRKIQQRMIFKSGEILFVFTYKKTANGKIANANEKVFQTYSYSRLQFELANIGHSITLDSFFKADSAVCFDCPFSQNRGCYTAKYQQYAGFLSSLRSIGRKNTWESIPEFSDDIKTELLRMSENTYSRFGTYGEPTLLPVSLMADICQGAKSWTGYTHQYMRKPEFAPYLMASLHHEKQVTHAEKLGFRAFIATKNKLAKPFVNCPASAEAGYKSTCSDCGLCSGSEGKGKKSVWILQH